MKTLHIKKAAKDDDEGSLEEEKPKGEEELIKGSIVKALMVKLDNMS